MTKLIYGLAVLFCAVAVSGCDQADDKKTEKSDENAKVTKVSIPESMNSKLAAADALDGTEDKHIHKCYVCSLGMDGKEEFTAEVNGYSACFCSEACLETFVSGAEKVVEGNKVPGTEDDTDNPSESDKKSTPE